MTTDRIPHILRFGAVALGAVLLSSCAGTPVTPTDGESSGADEITVVTNYVPTSFAIDRNSTTDIFVNTQARLIRPVAVPDEASGQFRESLTDYEGVLAESYDVSADGLVYTFVLRTGVNGYDGDELNADDVMYSFERKFNGKGSTAPASMAPALTDLSQVRKVDERTVSITVHEPGEGAMLLSSLSYSPGSIYDMDILTKHASAEDPYAMDWTANPTPESADFGFGAYRVTAVSDTGYTLEANPNYALGEVDIKKVNYRKVADGSTRASALQSGDADIAQGLRPFDAKALDDAGAANAFVFDSINTILTMDLVTAHAPFDNVAVRKALALAIPYDKIKSDVYFDRAIETRGRLDPLAPGYIADGIEANSSDAAAAKQMLADAGFPNGLSFALTITDTQADTEDAAVQIQSYAAAAGFDISINKLGSAAFATDSSKGVFDATLVPKTASNGATASQLATLYRDAPYNWSRWIDPTFLGMVDATTVDPDQTSDAVAQKLHDAELYLVAAQPSIWISRPQPTIAYSTAITGVVQRLDPYMNLSTMSVS